MIGVCSKDHSGCSVEVGRVGERGNVWQFVRRLQLSVQLHIITAPRGAATQEMEKKGHEYERL